MRRSIHDQTPDDSVARATFEQKFLTTRGRVYRLAYKMLGNSSDAEDIAQETFVRAWLGYDRFDSSRSFEAWVLRITHNLCIDFKRRLRRRPEFSLDTPPATEADREAGSMELADISNDPAARLFVQVLDERLELGLQALSPPFRECILLLAQDHSYEEIATILHCPLGTIRSRVHRMRHRLSELMAPEKEGAVSCPAY